MWLDELMWHQAYRSITNFRGVLRCLLHGSIFSRVGASSKSGAIQFDDAGSHEANWSIALILDSEVRNYLSNQGTVGLFGD
jgi:hypothetical protein